MAKLKTFLCEKPSQAADWAKYLGMNQSNRRINHWLDEKNGICVAHAVGHLFELEPLEKFEPALAKSWSLSHLPVFPDKQGIELKKEHQKLWKTLAGILAKSHTVVIATDKDNEGELIARDIIEQAKFKGKVERVLYSATDNKSLKTALDNPVDETKTRFMAAEADLRRRLDHMIGLNLTMAMTTRLKQAKELAKGAFSVGRVITATGLMVNDLEKRIKNFKPVKYYNVDATCVDSSGHSFVARLNVPEVFLDEDGRCVSKQAADKFCSNLGGQELTVINVEEEKKSEVAPLPHDLGSLQLGADKFSIEADETLALLQTLYDKPLSSVTYPRTDCRYLPEGMLVDVAMTVKHLNDLREFRDLDVDLKKKPKSFNDGKVDIHHGIVPSTKGIKLNALTEKQLIIYMLIAVRYMMQFMRDYEYIKQKVTLGTGKLSLIAKTRRTVEPGWKVATKLEGGNELAGSDAIDLSKGQIVKVVSAEVVECITTAPSRLTTSKLVDAMGKPWLFVQDEQMKKLLKENGCGIGTPATRSDVVKRALQKNVLGKKGRFVVPSALFSKHSVKLEKMSPAFTSLMQHQFRLVVKGSVKREDFMKTNRQFVERMMEEWEK